MCIYESATGAIAVTENSISTVPVSVFFPSWCCNEERCNCFVHHGCSPAPIFTMKIFASCSSDCVSAKGISVVRTKCTIFWIRIVFMENDVLDPLPSLLPFLVPVFFKRFLCVWDELPSQLCLCVTQSALRYLSRYLIWSQAHINKPFDLRECFVLKRTFNTRFSFCLRWNIENMVLLGCPFLLTWCTALCATNVFHESSWILHKWFLVVRDPTVCFALCSLGRVAFTSHLCQQKRCGPLVLWLLISAMLTGALVLKYDVDGARSSMWIPSAANHRTNNANHLSSKQQCCGHGKCHAHSSFDENGWLIESVSHTSTWARAAHLSTSFVCKTRLSKLKLVAQVTTLYYLHDIFEKKKNFQPESLSTSWTSMSYSM